MNRRDFFKRAAGFAVSTVAASTVLDPDRILWVPGAKTFFFPGKPFVPEPDIAVPPEPEMVKLTLASEQEMEEAARVFWEAPPQGPMAYQRGYQAQFSTGRFNFAGQVSKPISARDLQEAQAYAEKMTREWSPSRRRR